MPRDKHRIDERNAALYRKYKELYNEKRLRYDDVINDLADRYFLNPMTVHKIILRAAQMKEGKSKHKLFKGL